MKDLEIHITRSWRKSISMSFDKNGVLQVKAPKLMLSSQIDAFISKNNSWIKKNYLKIKERQKEKKLYLFGEPFTTPPVTSGHPPRGEGTIKYSLTERGGGVIMKSEGAIQEKQKLENFYKLQAKKYIIPRCNELAGKYGFSHKGIRITSAVTRWGSCSSKKTLNFSYRLVMAPKDSIDYVIIHELCHLRQMNHSSKFWSEVASIMPEYKQHEKHLKEFGWRYIL